ncbi:MAG: GNAT family N-acetyltransferase [Armatimonadia bacterium]
MEYKVEICTMQPEQIPFGMTLKEAAGWNQLPLDWERFQEFEPNGCFVARCDGELAGTATSIAYEKLFGWVGMVLVHEDMRRRGLGRALLMAGIEYLEEQGVAAVKLDATPMGKQLYDTIGFVDEYLVERWQGRGGGEAPEGLRELTLEDLPQMAAFDRPIFGADRSRVLRRALVEPTMLVAGSFADSGELEGYVALRPGAKAMYLGPWIAHQPETAQRLWDWALAVAGDAPLFVDIMGPNPNVSAIVQASEFEKQRHLIRMYRGENVSPGQPELQYGIFGPEIG